MWVPFFALPLATQLVVAVADGVPNLDVTASCRAAGEAAGSKDRMQNCLDSEKKTRDLLVKDWSTFTPADRADCIKSIVSFAPTYTELITCLEMRRDVKKIPGDTGAKDVKRPR
jgi:hypothetical protein